MILNDLIYTESKLSIMLLLLPLVGYLSTIFLEIKGFNSKNITINYFLV